MTTSPCIIVNPQAQSGARQRPWEKIAPSLEPWRALGGSCTITEQPGHASEVCRQALHNGCDLIIAVGGDGTVNEVVNGFFEGDQLIHPQAELGLVMAGTGSDLQRSLWDTTTLDDVIKRLNHPATRPVDVGRCVLEEPSGETVRYFLNVATWGMSGEVAKRVNTSKILKRFGGRLTYLVPSMLAGVTYRNKKVRLQMGDGDEDMQCVNSIAVCNARYFGGGMHIAPSAAFDDGVLDVVTIGDVNAFDMAMQLPRVYRGTHLTHPKATYQRTGQITLRACDHELAAINVDGEYFQAKAMTCTLLPRALRLRGV